jgi:hypothetical protein
MEHNVSFIVAVPVAQVQRQLHTAAAAAAAATLQGQHIIYHVQSRAVRAMNFGAKAFLRTYVYTV